MRTTMIRVIRTCLLLALPMMASDNNAGNSNLSQLSCVHGCVFGVFAVCLLVWGREERGMGWDGRALFFGLGAESKVVCRVLLSLARRGNARDMRVQQYRLISCARW